MLVFSRSEDWIYLKSGRLLQAIIDGRERLTLGEMNRDTGDVMRNARGVIETMRLDLPFAQIERLANGIKVEMRIGPDEFELTKGQLTDLREWVEHFPAARKTMIQ